MLRLALGALALAATLTPVGAAAQATSASAPPPSQPAIGSIRGDGARLVDGAGNEIRITGVNWFGMETETFAPHGLWTRNWQEMLDQIAVAGFNTIRLPYSNQLFDPASKPNGIDFNKNPDLAGLSGLEIMDRIVDGAGRRGLKVILDRHRPTAQAQSDLWYTDQVSEARWIQDWVMLAGRYKGNDTVIGADLHNEPRGPATWGDGNTKTDWRLAAERAGNAILAVNPDWLILVQGIEQQSGQWYWWGGNLIGAQTAPVRLSDPTKLVYSPHEYGPGVYGQPWFRAADFPNNLPGLWRQFWAYLRLDNVAPVLVGEFGGRSVGSDAEGTWQRNLVAFLRENGISYTYWSWNPDSGDTGGVLQDDWFTLNKAKEDLLAGYQWPLLGAPRPDAAKPIAAAPSMSDRTAPAAGAPAGAPAGSNTPSTAQGAPQPPVPVAAGGVVALGGPFDPDPVHVRQGIGGPNDPEAARRAARQRDEQRYLDQFGKPWDQAAYVTGNTDPGS